MQCHLMANAIYNKPDHVVNSQMCSEGVLIFYISMLYTHCPLVCLTVQSALVESCRSECPSIFCNS